MSFIDDLINRGYYYQSTDLEKLKELTADKKIAAYIGFDCTASSLHVGNLMQIMILRLFQQHGHKPIVLVGGTTTKIGDPSGKDEARKMLTDEDISANMAGIKKSLSKFIQFGDGPSDAIMVNNSNWLDPLGYIEFLRDYGRFFSVNRMLTMESVKLRLEREQHLTFLEFNYMLLQAYDFCYLNKHHNCILQIGGSDQWGNIVMGTELTKKVNGAEVYGLTTPLLATSSGVKMGKSVNGAIWINEEVLSPYEYYQYWRNCEDPDVVRFAKLYAEFNKEELAEFTSLAEKDINAAKKNLALKVTSLCHGEFEAEVAAETARKVFEEGMVSDNLPQITLEHNKIAAGILAYDLLFESGVTESKSEAKRLIRGRGVKIDDVTIEDENLKITLSDVKNNALKLSVGKKKHTVIRLADK
jgi:tyrosyl-tRNA synthetase